MFVKRMPVIYTKGLNMEAFNLIGKVRTAISEYGSVRHALRDFNDKVTTTTSYEELLELCREYVILDDTLEAGTEPGVDSTRNIGPWRTITDDREIPGRRLLWTLAEALEPLSKAFTIRVSDEWRGAQLWLASTDVEYANSACVWIEKKYESSPSVVKMKGSHGGLIINTPLLKVDVNKVVTKMIASLQFEVGARIARDKENAERAKRVQAAKNMTKHLGERFEIPEYFEGSTSRRLSADGVELSMDKSEYGNGSTVKLTLYIDDEPAGIHPDKLAPIIEQVKAIIKLRQEQRAQRLAAAKVNT